MRKVEVKWKENPKWWHYNENGLPIINNDAPEEAKESYKKYREQCESIKY
ncbi:MAG: hypothetical protein ACOX1F_07965 [Erysipelotrichaceae bacterium]|jgi:hypothetical protein